MDMEPYYEAAGERRRLGDRRQTPTRFWKAPGLRGRRRGYRRAGEGLRAYVDIPSTATAALAILIVVASSLDALFTPLHLAAGAFEANPVMAIALERGLPVFLSIKLGTTTVGVIFLAVHQNFPLGIRGLWILLSAYGLLIVYHLALFAAVI